MENPSACSPFLIPPSSSSAKAIVSDDDDASSTPASVALYEALVAFLGTFPTVQDIDVDTLNDGVQILDCLSEIAPDTFPPTLLHRDRLDNWILRHSNIRKLVRHVELYFSTTVHRSCWNGGIMDEALLEAIAKGEPKATMEPLLRAVAIAAVHHPTRKSIYVQRILTELSVDHQAALRNMLLVAATTTDSVELTEEITLTEDMTETSAGTAQDPFHLEEEETKLVEQTSALQRRNQKMDESRTNMTHSNYTATTSACAIDDDDDDDYQRHMDAADAKIVAVEQTLREMQRRYEEQVDETKRLADDLDVATAAQQQLYRAQATAAVYKERWEALVDTNEIHTRGNKAIDVDTDSVASLHATIAKLQAQLQAQLKEEEETVAKSTTVPVPVSPDRSANTDAPQDDVATLQQEVRRIFDAYQRKTSEHANVLDQLDQSIAPDVYQQSCDALSLAQTEAYEWRERAEHLERIHLQKTDQRGSTRRERKSKQKTTRNNLHEVMSRTIREYGLGMY